jgi:hypothetical protein
MKTNTLLSFNVHHKHELYSGKINESDGKIFQVETHGGTIAAKMAASCLLQPQPGDQVLVSCAPAETFILAVLNRMENDFILNFPGNTTINSPEGQLKLQAREDLQLTSLKDISIQAPKVNTVAKEQLLITEEIKLMSDKAHVNVTEVSLIAKNVITAFDQLTQHAKNVMRVVENMETLQIGHLVKHIKKTLTIRTGQAVISAEKDMRLDAERIHMG